MEMMNSIHDSISKMEDMVIEGFEELNSSESLRNPVELMFNEIKNLVVCTLTVS